MTATARRRAPNRLRARINLVLDPRAKALLDRTANAGRYVDFVLREHEQRWRAALAALQAAGWTPNEVFAAREAVGHLTAATPAQILAGLRRVAEGTLVSWAVREADWAARVHACEAEDELACAVLRVVQEMDAGNLDIAGAIEGSGPERAGGE